MRAQQGQSRPFSPGPSPSKCRALSMWHPARWTAAAAFPPPRTSAIGYKHPPACSTPRLRQDSAPALSETARRLPGRATYRGTALLAANVPAEGWDPAPRLSSRNLSSGYSKSPECTPHPHSRWDTTSAPLPAVLWPPQAAQQGSTTAPSVGSLRYPQDLPPAPF